MIQPPDEPNPYQAPAVEPTRPLGDVKTRGINSGAAMAARLLHLRDRGGYGLGVFLRWNLRRYLFSSAIVAALLAFWAAVGAWGAFFGFLGAFVGMFLRDLEWLAAMQTAWPFTVRVTDWDKVRAFADGEDPS